jgi:hypothetical protein
MSKEGAMSVDSVRALLVEVAYRRVGELPPFVVSALSAAADELLTDPSSLLALCRDEAATSLPVAEVIALAQRSLRQLQNSAVDVAVVLACARAARELTAAAAALEPSSSA